MKGCPIKKLSLFSIILLVLIFPLGCGKSIIYPVVPMVPATYSTATATFSPVPPTATSTPTQIIPDANLRAAVGQVLYQNHVLASSSGTITAADLATLTSLVVEGAGVTSIEGLEYCTSLTHLDIKSNPVTDLSPLAGLTGLQRTPTDNLTEAATCAILYWWR